MMLRTLCLFALLGSALGFLPAYSPLALKPQAFATPSLRSARAGVSSIKMTPVSSNDFRTGTTLLIDGNVYKVLEFLHVKPGKGSAFVRTKLKNLTGGGNLEKTFKAGEMVEGAELNKLEVQFNYMDGDTFVFMDMQTFETTELSPEVVGDNNIWMKEGTEVGILMFGDKVLDIDIPLTMTLEVTETDPGVKGNTAQGGDKPAKLETGAEVKVPLFIQQGELIKVDTVNKKYLSRAKE